MDTDDVIRSTISETVSPGTFVVADFCVYRCLVLNRALDGRNQANTSEHWKDVTTLRWDRLQALKVGCSGTISSKLSSTKICLYEQAMRDYMEEIKGRFSKEPVYTFRSWILSPTH